MANFTARSARPSAAIRDQYERGLRSLIEEMNNSVLYWLSARYNARADEIVAADASPSKELEKELKDLMRQWGRKFDEYAVHRARWFAKRVNTSTTNQLKGALKDAGLTVKFRNSRRVNNMYQATVAENVNLIKTIPQQYLSNVNTIVMQSVRNGRDMGFIAKQIQEQYGKSKARAITIARDQTNKATEAVSQARAADIGITHGFWMHRSGGKVPRPTHEGFDGQRFELAKGLYDPQAWKKKGGYVGQWVKPAELINCHCTFKLDLSTITGNGVATDSKRRGVILVKFASGSTVEYAKAA